LKKLARFLIVGLDRAYNRWIEYCNDYQIQRFI